MPEGKGAGFYEQRKGDLTMSKTYHYLAFQYSAIQKTVLRHFRLWSVAGLSRMLSDLNEIQLPRTAEAFGGKALVAGGGKFTARFENGDDAEKCRSEIIRLVSAKLPMLEYQISEKSVSKASLKEAKEDLIKNDLAVQKNAMRGYGLTFNPHAMRCQECGEYPAEQNLRVYRGQGEDKKMSNVCRVCHAANEMSRLDVRDLINEDSKELTSLDIVYRDYVREMKLSPGVRVPQDFDDLFSKSGPTGDDRPKRMAVWFSDINNMNAKVPVWLAQKDEDIILDTFDQVKKIFIRSLVQALLKTPFQTVERDGKTFLPFRLAVAGGDDLCLVMDERYVVDFALELAGAVDETIAGLPEDHPLHEAWLEKHRDKDKSDGKSIEPYGFGAAFVVASVHTPFSRIHQIGEELMKKAKNEAGRKANSVNWRIMAEEDSLSESLLRFERPLFVKKNGDPDFDRLTFEQYAGLAAENRNISGSHTQQLVSWMIETENDPAALELKMVKGASAEGEKSYYGLLEEELLRVRKGKGIDPARLATLLEILTIRNSDNGGSSQDDANHTEGR